MAGRPINKKDKKMSNHLTKEDNDTILYFHDQLLTIIRRSGMPPKIAAPAVMMLCASLLTNSTMTPEELAAEFLQCLEKANMRVAEKQSHNSTKN